MDDLDSLAETVDSVVLQIDVEGTITAATPDVETQLGYDPSELRGMDVTNLFPDDGDSVPRPFREDRPPSDDPFHTETTILTATDRRDPVKLGANYLPDRETIVLSIRNLREGKRRTQYLQFARDVKDLIIEAQDETTLLREMIVTVTDRQFGCTSICLLDHRDEPGEIYGVMEDWCEMNWEGVYTEEYVEEVFDKGDIVIEDVTRGPHRQHTVEKADHGAIALTLAHKDTRFGILTLHLPEKGSVLSDAERDLLRELADNVSTGLYNLRAETDLRESRKQLAVLDRMLRHNLRNAVSVILAHAGMITETASEKPHRHAERIREQSTDLVDTTNKERHIVKLILDTPEVAEIDLSSMLEQCVSTCRRAHPDATISADVPASARVLAIHQLPRAIRELVENAVVHNDRKLPTVNIDVQETGEVVHIDITDDGPGIPEQETRILTTDVEVEPLEHGSGVALWLVNWIIELSHGAVQFREREPRGSVVRLTLPSV